MPSSIPGQQIVECGYASAYSDRQNPTALMDSGKRYICVTDSVIMQFFPSDTKDTWYICAYVLEKRIINGTQYPAGQRAIPPTLRNMHRNGLLPSDPRLNMERGIYPALLGEWWVRDPGRFWTRNPYCASFMGPFGMPEESDDQDVGVPSVLQFIRDDGDAPTFVGQQIEAGIMNDLQDGPYLSYRDVLPKTPDRADSRPSFIDATATPTRRIRLED
jgi:hypothetical protein